MRFKAICLIICSLCTFNVYAETIEVCGDLQQGELVWIKNVASDDFVVYDNVRVEDLQKRHSTASRGKKYPVDQEGNVLVALHRDAPNNMVFTAAPNTFFVLDIVPSKWDIQRINGVSPSKVTPDKSAKKEIERESSDVGRAVNHIQVGDFWRKGFIVPVDGRISGHFGNQRIFNGIPKSPHTGTDIAAPEGAPVKASGDGIVILNGQNYFYTGNMVIIDHGQGLHTIYAHLQKSTVKVGDNVKQGDIIGYVGKTGRATGAHLHWGASLNNVRFRPHSLLDINQKSCKIIDSFDSENLKQKDDNK